MIRQVAAGIVIVLLASVAFAGEAKRARFGYPPEMPGGKEEVYKTVGDVKLKLYIFEPEGHKAGDRRAAIVFFFGGGWTSGSPVQFLNQCKYLASRGMVAISADYRVASRQQVKAVQCVADAKSAIRWVRTNAARLGIDPERIAAGGGSAGGHLAACCGTVSAYDEAGEDASVSSVPNAMVLFNPAVVLAANGLGTVQEARRLEGLEARMGVAPVSLSPYHNVKKGAPPTIVFHGTADTTVPFKTVELFAAAMSKAGNVCKVVPGEGAGHGYFNYGRDDNKHYEATVRAMDAFLVERGFLGKLPGGR